MSKRPIRIIQWGCGMMGQILIRTLREKGAELVGAIDHNAARRDRDAGEVAGLGKPLGVRIHPPEQAEAVFREARADVCILCTRSTVSEMADPLRMAARHGVNAITIGEEAFFPWTTSKELTEELDRLAKANGCTITGSGYQDVFWGNLITVLAGSTHRIDRIVGLTQYNVDDYGSAVAQKHGVGLDPDTFATKIGASNTPAYVWNSNEWLCARLGWRVRDMRQQLLPTTHTEALRSTSLGREIPAGHATGMKAVVVTETHEGPVIETHCVGKIYAPGEVDLNEWTLRGEPDTTVTIRQPATPALTCAVVLNRLPQLVSAPAGFITTDRFEPAPYVTRLETAA
ncbi:dihydrodipicolinate reductase [Archangium violaceum]|uniref:NAD(P)H-dependent amine dehydrogenase family protein n=1 Tax=Archangium violaceum TaxID=83451 RepID=UPI00194DEA56|nr:dihydrodipicolinate reductase [Archangium violaceum]QRN97595.1 dihydrodipicolinate reductase [Archangium violaceum]